MAAADTRQRPTARTPLSRRVHRGRRYDPSVASSSDAPSPTILPFGSWPTPITSELIVRAAASLSGRRSTATRSGGPSCGPRRAAAPRSSGGRRTATRPTCCLPVATRAPLSTSTAAARGGCAAGTLWFVELGGPAALPARPGGEPVPVTPEPEVPRGERWADGDVTRTDGRIAVRPRAPPGRSAGRPTWSTRSSCSTPTGRCASPRSLVSGPGLRVRSPLVAGRRRAVLARVGPPGHAVGRHAPHGATRAMPRRPVAGGPDESVSQPRWARDGSLWFISDRSGWWNLYRWTPGGGVEPMVDDPRPRSVCRSGSSASRRYAFLRDGRVVFAYCTRGLAISAHLLAPTASVVDLDGALHVDRLRRRPPATGRASSAPRRPRSPPSTGRRRRRGAVRRSRCCGPRATSGSTRTGSRRPSRSSSRPRRRARRLRAVLPADEPRRHVGPGGELPPLAGDDPRRSHGAAPCPTLRWARSTGPAGASPWWT